MLRKHRQEPDERRMEVRLTSCISARIWALGAPTPAYSKDISASGVKLQVISPCRFRAGEKYRLEIDLPKEEGAIRAYAHVVRIDEDGELTEHWKLAMHFDSISPDDQSKIRRYVFRREIERQRLGLK